MGEDSGLHISIGFGGALALIFITLKLLHQISWSWFWIISPLWIPFAIGGVVVIVGLLFIGVVSVVERIW